MTPQITQKLSEASAPLVELTSETLKKDSLKLTQFLVMISLKILEDSENYVLDLNAVNYTDYLNDEFFFLMYSHHLTEEKIIFAVTSVRCMLRYRCCLMCCSLTLLKEVIHLRLSDDDLR